MVSSFINPVISNASKLGIGLFEDLDPMVQFTGNSSEEIEIIIRAVYKQVLGNTYIMEEERLTVVESQLKNGTITVREFVRQVAKSELYRSRFFDNYPSYRSIELNFKHLFGRAPNDSLEMRSHIQLLDESGFEAEIDSYLDSDEYKAAFGENTVPFYKTQTGKNILGFSHLFQLLRGSSSSDKSSVLGTYSGLNKFLLTDTPMSVVPLIAKSTYRPVTNVNKLLAGVLNLNNHKSVTVTRNKNSAINLSDDEVRQRQYQAFEAIDPVELYPGASSDEIETVIRAAYKQVFGNAHIMESERLTVPESQLKMGEISVREFVRQVAKSELYRSRFFETCYRYRGIELNFKHLLGRAPDDYNEMVYHSNILDEIGFEADIDSYLDSDEYINNFGDNIVPYYRGYSTQTGKKMLGFTNMFQLLQSNSSSDKNPASGNKPQLTRALIANSPFGKLKPSDVKAILAEVFKPKAKTAAEVNKFAIARLQAEQALQKQIEEQQSQIATLQKQLSDLRPFANIGASQINNSWQSSSSDVSTDENASLQQILEQQTAQIAALQEQVADARRFATIGEARLNKWRSRTFVG